MGVRKNLLIKQRYLVKCKKENLFELDTKSILHHGRVVITCTPRQGHVLLAVSWLYNEQICMGTCVGSSLQEAVVKAELEWQEMSWWRCLRKTKGRRSRSRHEKLSMPNVGLMPEVCFPLFCFVLFSFWPCRMVYGLLVLWPGLELIPPPLAARILNH